METFINVLTIIAFFVILYFVIKTAVTNAILSTREVATDEDSNKNNISQTTCPQCGKLHDLDYPKCPHCGHDYREK